MTTGQALLAFVATAGLLAMTPGIDTAMVMRVAAVEGARRAAHAAAGIALGCLAWGVAVSVGLAALLTASSLAFAIVQWAGAAYLAWQGVLLLVRPRSASPAAQAAAREASPLACLRRGFLTNMLNPKVGVFYVSFLPQFVPTGASVASFSLLLAVIHVLLSLLWFAVLIVATMPMGRVLSRAGVVRAIDRVTGGVFILFGIKLALSKAP